MSPMNERNEPINDVIKMMKRPHEVHRGNVRPVPRPTLQRDGNKVRMKLGVYMGRALLWMLRYAICMAGEYPDHESGGFI